MNAVKRTSGLCYVLLAIAAVAAVTSLPGCHSAAHPDDRAAVFQALNQHDLSSVEVSQDRGKGIITLRGIVGSQEGKDRAQQFAEQAAPGYTIQNQLTVDNSGLMSLSNPNAKRPEVEEMAHPPAGNGSTSSATVKAKPGNPPQR